MANGKPIWYAQMIDNTGLKKGGQEADAIWKKIGDSASSEGMRIEHLWKGVGRTVGGALAGISIGGFVKQMFQIRASFQDAESAMTLFLGSAEKAGKFMKELQDYAWYNAFEFSDLVAESKQLLAYGNAVETVIPILDQLSNVAIATRQPLGNLVDLYNKAKNIGSIDSIGLKQWASAGLVVTDVLKEMGVRTDGSKVSFEQLEMVLGKVTSEGGRFHKQMEQMMPNLSMSFGQLQDDITNMFNELGKQTEGAMKGGIEFASTLVANYESIGKAITVLIATYGAYRGAVIVTNIVLKEQAAINSMVAASNGVFNKSLAAQFLWTERLKKAQVALNKTMLANPYVLIATLIVGLTASMWALSDSTTAAERAQKRLNDEQEKYNKKQEEQKQRVEQLIRILRDETETKYAQVAAYEELQKLSPAITKAYSREQLATAELSKTTKTLNEERDKQNYNKLINDIDNTRDSIQKLKQQQKATLSQPILTQQDSAWLSALAKEEEVQVAYLAKLEKNLEDHNKRIAEMEFNALPQADRIKIKQETLDKIRTEFEKVKAVLEEEQRKIDNKEIFYIPFQLKAQFGTLQKQYKQAAQDLANQTNKVTTYDEARKEALKEWNKAKATLSTINKDRKKYSQKEYEDAVAEVKKTKEAAANLGIDVSGKTNKSISDAADKLSASILKTAQSREDLRISQIKNEGERVRKQIEVEYRRQIEEISRQEKEWLKAQGKLTEEQQEWVRQSIALAKDTHADKTAKNEENALKTQVESMQAYLKEYGTFQQQKLAIAQEYAKRIRKAEEQGDEFEAKRLKKEEQANTSAIDTAAIRAEIDWATVFGGFEGMFRDVITSTLDKVKKYTQTNEYKNLDHSDQQALIEAIQQMEKSLGGIGNFSFKKLSQEVQAYQNALRELSFAQDKEKESISKLKEAQEAYEESLKDGTDEQKAATKEAFDLAQQNANAASAVVESQTGVVRKAQQDVSDTATKLKTSMNNVTDGLEKLASGGLKNAYDGLIQLGNGFGGVMGKLAKSLESVPILGPILSMLDILKDGLGNLIGGLLDGVFDTVSGILNDVLSGDLLKTVGESVINGVDNILRAVTFGFSDKLVSAIRGGNEREVNETTNRLTASNVTLKQSIDALKAEMEKAKGSQTVDTYNQALEKQGQLIKNTSEILAAQMRYASAHHSNNYYIDKNMSGASWDKISELLGKRVAQAAELWTLSPEELRKVSTLTDVWDVIYNGGKYDKSEYIDQYLELADSLVELEDALNSTLTQTTFDNIYDSFIDTLMDMESSAEDFADDVSKYFMRAMLSNMIGNLYADKLNEWYKKFAEGLKDGDLSEAEREALRQEYMDYVNEALKLRDELADVTGYADSTSDSSREASSKGFASMSQDSADELNGRFTAIQGHTYGLLQNSNSMLESVRGIQEQWKHLQSHNAQVLEHLSGIHQNTGRLEAIETSMVSVRTSLSNIELKGIVLQK